MRHSPGPWAYRNTYKGQSIQAANGELILGTDGSYDDWAPTEDGDWRLIAAAPTLLKELKRYLPILEHLKNCEPLVWAEAIADTDVRSLDDCYNAIKLAEGKV